MRYFTTFMFAVLLFIIVSCGGGGGGKGGDPVPTPAVIPPVVVVTPPASGGNTGGSTGGTVTYTVTTKNINTIGGTINYSADLTKILKTGCSNANSGGIQTADGGSVTVELLNATNAKVTNLGDALDLTFAVKEDPILEYTETNETAKTKTKTDIHLNAFYGSHLFLQGTTLTAFKNNAITYDAAYAISKVKSSTQAISYVAYKQ